MSPVIGFFERHRIAIAVVYLIVIPAGFIFGALLVSHELQRQAAQGKEAHDAICVFRQDLERRVENGRVFLAQHPEGFAGIDAATLRNSLDNQQRTVDSLAGIHCDTKGAP